MIQYSFSSRFETVKAAALFDAISLRLREKEIDPLELADNLYFDSVYWSQFLQGNLTYWTPQTQESHHFF
jgi:hypothetical protein